MSEMEFEMMGATEKFAVEQMTKAIWHIREQAISLAESLNGIGEDEIAAAMLDHKKRETVTQLIEPLQKAGTSLTMHGLLALMVKTMVKS